MAPVSPDATCDVTGPEAFTLDEAADLLSTHTGREIRYVPETRDEAFASRAHYGAAQWEVEGWVSSYEAIAVGELATVSNTVESVTGHRPMSLAEYFTANPASLAGLYAESSTAEVSIENPARWRKQLVSHLGHKIETQSLSTSSVFNFHGGFGVAQDTETGLILGAEAAAPETITVIKDVLGRHLERFAHKLGTTVSWT